jgi:hypothetical protein
VHIRRTSSKAIQSFVIFLGRVQQRKMESIESEGYAAPPRQSSSIAESIAFMSALQSVEAYNVGGGVDIVGQFWEWIRNNKEYVKGSETWGGWIKDAKETDGAIKIECLCGEWISAQLKGKGFRMGVFKHHYERNHLDQSPPKRLRPQREAACEPFRHECPVLFSALPGSAAEEDSDVIGHEMRT